MVNTKMLKVEEIIIFFLLAGCNGYWTDSLPAFLLLKIFSETQL